MEVSSLTLENRILWIIRTLVSTQASLKHLLSLLFGLISLAGFNTFWPHCPFLFNLSAKKKILSDRDTTAFKNTAILIPSRKSIPKIIVKHALQINRSVLPQKVGGVGNQSARISQQLNWNSYFLSNSEGMFVNAMHYACNRNTKLEFVFELWDLYFFKTRILTIFWHLNLKYADCLR